MANTKIRNLTEISSVATGDFLHIVDVSDTTFGADGTNKQITKTNFLNGFDVDSLTATATELNIMDGVTSSTAELNILDGVTSTATELNILDGVTASTAEINKLDGVAGDVVGTSDTQTLTNKTIGASTLSGNMNVGTYIMTNAYIDSPVIQTAISGTAVLDEDDMSSDSATKISTQQSTKAYVDNKTRTRSLWIPASSFDISTGTPTQADFNSNIQYWAMADATTDGVSSSIIVPMDYASGNLTLYIYWMAVAVAGDCAWRIKTTDNLAEGVAVTSSILQDLVDTTGGTSGTLNITAGTALTNTTGLTAGYFRGIGIQRLGSAGADTLEADANFFGVRIDYTGY